MTYLRQYHPKSKRLASLGLKKKHTVEMAANVGADAMLLGDSAAALARRTAEAEQRVAMLAECGGFTGAAAALTAELHTAIASLARDEAV